VTAALLVLSLLAGCWPAAEEAPKPERAAKVGKGAKAKKAEVAVAPLTDELKALPNVLVIVWDTVRADHTSLYGYPKPTTPKTAAWAAAQGVVYERAVSPGVWTLPSHASLFTGLPERGHGVDASHNWLDDDHVTVAESLASQGFDTYAFVANPYLPKETNILQGFAKVESPWSPRWKAASEAHMKSKLIPDDASTPVSPKFDGKGGAGNNKYLFKEAGPVAAEALFAWADARPEPERPFFAFLNYMEAHLPRIPSMEARRQVMSEALIQRSFGVIQSTTTFHEYMVGVHTYDPLDLEAIVGVYDASLIDLDAATAALFDELDRRGLADDTIIVLTSDHGENLGDHGLLLHKYTVANSLSRVPLVVSWKGHLAPTRIEQPTSVAAALVDALDAGKIPLDAALRERLQGRDPDKHGAVAEYGAIADGSIDRMKKLHPDVSTARLERTFEGIEHEQWKLVLAMDGAVELYDVRADPNETKDVAAEHPDVVEALRARLEGFRADWPKWVPRDGSVHPRDAALKEGLEALGYVQ
jgi:arylsulfatase A-like enzyme